MLMLYEKVINTPNWSILQKIAFPLKIKIKERLDSDIYSIATHIQRYKVSQIVGQTHEDKEKSLIHQSVSEAFASILFSTSSGSCGKKSIPVSFST